MVYIPLEKKAVVMCVEDLPQMAAKHTSTRLSILLRVNYCNKVVLMLTCLISLCQMKIGHIDKETTDIHNYRNVLS